MDSRQGTCGPCQKIFRVPAHLEAAKAKCPKCGGALELAPLRESASAAAATVAEPARPATARGKHEPPARATGAAASRPGRTRVHAAGEGAHGGRRRGAPAKAKSPVPLIAGGLVALAVVVFAVVKLAGGSDAEPVALAQAPEPLKPDLSHIPDAAKLPETTDQEWTQMNELMAGYATPPFDRNAERNGDRLAPKGLAAVPAILNGWKRLDFSTSEGAALGWKIQTLLLQDRCGGTNFGWQKDTRADAIAFNTKVIERWFQAWSEAGADAAKWTEIAKTGINPPAAAPEQSE